MAGAPGDLTLTRDRDLAGRAWHPWVRRGLLGLVVLLPLVALANVFGQQPSTSTAAAGAATLSVYAPEALRGGDMFEVRARVVAHRAITQPTLTFDSGWLEEMTLNGVAPQPSTESGTGSQVSYQYDPMEAGQTMTVWLYFQVNPINVGHRSANVSIADGSQSIASVERSITIFP